MSLVNRILYETRGGQFREYVGIVTHVSPKDVALYRRLLPQVLDMPARPTVTIYVADFIKVGPWPLTRYQEWSVLLLSLYHGDEAWFPVTMPVTKLVPMLGGRHIGFPKYVADSIVVSKEGDANTGTGTHKGKIQVQLRFEAGHSRTLAEWEKGLADNPAFFKGSGYCLVPPGVGPRLLRVDLVNVVPPKWDPRHGMVTVRVDPGEPWAGLLPEGGPFPGTYNHFLGGVNLSPNRLV